MSILKKNHTVNIISLSIISANIPSIHHYITCENWCWSLMLQQRKKNTHVVVSISTTLVAESRGNSHTTRTCIERWCQTRIRGTGYSLTAYKSFRVQSFQSLVKRYSFVYREIISLSFSLSFSLSVSRFNLFNHVRASSCSDGSTKIWEFWRR